MKCRDFLIKLFWQELEIVLVGIGPRQIPQQIKLHLHLDREGTHHQPRIRSRPEANTITRCRKTWILQCEFLLPQQTEIMDAATLGNTGPSLPRQ